LLTSLAHDDVCGGGESTGELHTRVAAFLKDVAQSEGDAIAIAHLGVLRAAYTLATGWDMATPMPTELDISKILLLSLTAALKRVIVHSTLAAQA